MNIKSSDSANEQFDNEWTLTKALTDLESVDVREWCSEYQDRIFDISNKLAQEKMKKGLCIS